MFGALLFLLLATLILETSGLEIILFLSQNEDSVNTKCKVELREVLQQVVSLHWNKCWFVQKKKACPFWILLVLTFYFLSLLKKCVPLDFRNLLTQLWGITEGCSNVHSQQICWTCCRWSGTCAGHKLEAREWVNEIKCTQILPPILSGLQLCCVEQLLYFWDFPHLFYWVKAYSKKMLLQGSPEGMLLLCLDSCLTIF